jgi:serine/threonine protein kinase
MRLTLNVTDGPHRGLSFSFAQHDTFLVGRSKHAHFQLREKDKYFSRIHFMMEVNPPYCRLIDMGSHNGTFVNGQRVLSADLKDGDQIRAGHTTLQLALQADPGDVDFQAPALEALPRIPGYMLEREIGSGGLGLLYQATRLADITPVAVKLVRPKGAANSQQVDAFLNEARRLGQLDHPHLVRLLDAGMADDWVYFVSDYVPAAQDAARIVQRELRLEVPRAMHWMDQLLGALEYAHERGVVHRDIKPRNVLITTGEDGAEQARWTDLGVARVYAASPLSGLTMTGDLDTIAAFLAPELLMNYQKPRRASDQYGAAALLYYLLTGSFIFDLPRELHRRFSVLMKQPVVPIQQRRVDIPDGLAAVLERALSRNPQQRYPNVAAFRAALHSAAVH